MRKITKDNYQVKTATSIRYRPFIKWPGSKYKLLDMILPKLSKGKILIEPFVGSGAVFLNTNYEHYILNDINYDVINLYKMLQQHGKEFIKFCRKFFLVKYNNATQYYKFREQFNNLGHHTKQLPERAALFLYLNRHGYNGLCRFNQRHQFNVPFGRYTTINLPEEAMYLFYLKAQRAEFLVKDFQDILTNNFNNPHQIVVYCDPPYVPISNTAKFVSYWSNEFNLKHQYLLAQLAVKLSNHNIPVLISNHFSDITKDIYKDASQLTSFKIRRMISCDPKNRNYVTEVLALYLPKN